MFVDGKNFVYESNADASGKYQLRFDSKNLPKEFLITASKEDFVPISINLSKEECSNDSRNIALSAIDETTIVVEIDPILHHLGDDYHQGTINSRFQKNTEGIEYLKPFNVSASQLYHSKYTMKLFAKGLQFDNPLTINGELVGYLGESASDGSFSSIAMEINSSFLMQGENTLRIQAALNPINAGDRDDFEFFVFGRFELHHQIQQGKTRHRGVRKRHRQGNP